MQRTLARLILPMFGVLLGAAVSMAAPDEQAARAAGQRFGEALTRSDASLLRPILPRVGKVQMMLGTLGPEKGYFSGSQVEALMRQFLTRGSVRGFTIERLEHGREGYALVHASAVIVDGSGRTPRCALHLTLQVEDDRWVLREIREVAR